MLARELLERLAEFDQERLETEVYRATSLTADPTAGTANGGRWGVPSTDVPGTSVLYTCFEDAGALAEVASYLAELTPLPRSNPLRVSRLAVSVAKAVTLSSSDLEALGVDMSRYGERDYTRTQEIGASLERLGVDALIAPSARWECDNLMIFTNEHGIDETIEVLDYTDVEWRDWARRNGLLDGLE